MKLKSFLNMETKSRIKYWMSRNQHTYDKYKGKRKAIVCLGADYGNLGDIAITFAQIQFLKKMLPNYEVIEFPISQTFTDLKSLQAVIDKNDIITMIGGGNTSERYNDIEFCREFIIRKFKNNRIICFPQSVELKNASERFIHRMRACYCTHRHLEYFVREQYSLYSVNEYLPELNAQMVPDIVFTLDSKYGDEGRRCGVTISLRDDKERKLNDTQQKEIFEILRKCDFGLLTVKDTQIKERMDFTEIERKRLLKKQMDCYRQSKLVITDRLHGMIMAYITNTPCIVFSGDNLKIRGGYEWIKKSPRVRYCEEYNREEFLVNINEILNRVYEDNERLSHLYFSKLIDSLKKRD